jgi:hypothetical protein
MGRSMEATRAQQLGVSLTWHHCIVTHTHRAPVALRQDRMKRVKLRAGAILLAMGIGMTELWL